MPFRDRAVMLVFTPVLRHIFRAVDSDHHEMGRRGKEVNDSDFVMTMNKTNKETVGKRQRIWRERFPIPTPARLQSTNICRKTSHRPTWLESASIEPPTR